MPPSSATTTHTLMALLLDVQMPAAFQQLALDHAREATGRDKVDIYVALAKQDDLDPAVRDALLAEGDGLALSHVADRADLTHDEMHRLAAHTFAGVRQCLARREDLPADLLHRLTHDRSPKVLDELARRDLTGRNDAETAVLRQQLVGQVATTDGANLTLVLKWLPEHISALIGRPDLTLHALRTVLAYELPTEAVLVHLAALSTQPIATELQRDTAFGRLLVDHLLEQPANLPPAAEAELGRLLHEYTAGGAKVSLHPLPGVRRTNRNPDLIADARTIKVTQRPGEFFEHADDPVLARALADNERLTRAGLARLASSFPQAMHVALLRGGVEDLTLTAAGLIRGGHTDEAKTLIDAAGADGYALVVAHLTGKGQLAGSGAGLPLALFAEPLSLHEVVQALPVRALTAALPADARVSVSQLITERVTPEQLPVLGGMLGNFAGTVSELIDAVHLVCAPAR